MEINDIKRLIEAFYNGETSIEEEKALFEYFANENVPEELLSEKRYFNQLRRLEIIKVPKELPSKIDSLFDSFEKQEIQTKRFRKLVAWASSAAAIIILFFTGYYYNMDKNLFIDNDTLLANNTAKIDSQLTKNPIFIDYPFMDLLSGNFINPYVVNDWDENELNDDYKKMEKALEIVSISLEQGLSQLDIISKDFPKDSELLNNM